MSSLRASGFVRDDGSPSELLEGYVNAPEQERKKILLDALKMGFRPLFEEGVDLTRITPQKFDDMLRNEYDLSSSTLDKAASFFLAAAEACGLSIGSHLANRKPASRKTAKARKQRDQGGASSTGGNGAQLPNNPPPPTQAKPLEYQLIDLMSEPDISDEVKGSIWSLVQYLTERKANRDDGSE